QFSYLIPYTTLFRSGEDARERLRGEVDVLGGDLGEVVDDRDRRDVERQLEGLAVAAALLRRLELLRLQGGVGAGELHGAVEELLAAGAGAGRVVADRHARVGLGEPGHPAELGVLLRGGAGAGDRAGELAGLVRAAAGRGCVVVPA